MMHILTLFFLSKFLFIIIIITKPFIKRSIHKMLLIAVHTKNRIKFKINEAMWKLSRRTFNIFKATA